MDHGMSPEQCQGDEDEVEKHVALSLSHWEKCMQCNTWVELGPDSADCEGMACPGCGEQV